MNSRRKLSAVSSSLYCGTAVVALAMFYPLAAYAQAGGDTSETVVVTGTSIKGSAPVGANVITVDRDSIEASGATTVQQLLTSVPSVTGFGNAGQGGFGSADGSGTAAPTIHSLGASASNSTLVLVDSHRIPLSGLAHTLADPSTIPQIALQRVEVLPDGASSIYGSDAVAGVLNFITRKNFNGAETDLEYGAGLEYDTVSFGQILGATWDKGSVMAAYNFVGRSKLLGTDRRYVADNQNALGLNNFGNFNCGPTAIAATSTSTTYLYPYTAAGIARTTGNSPCGQTSAASLAPSESRHNALVSITDQVTDWLTLRSDLNWSNRTDDAAVSRGIVNSTVFGPGSGKGSQINPFYVAVPGSATGTEYASYDFNALFGPGAHTKSGTQLVYGTFDADFTLPGDWTGAVETMFGNSVSYSRTIGTVCTACAYLALNGTTNANGSLTTSSNPAVLNTTTITTRPLNTTNALNVWGALGSTAAGGANTAAVVKTQLLDNNNFSQTTQNINDVNVRLNGTLFSLPAGDIKVAVGGEYRNYGIWQYAVQNGSGGPSITNSTIFNASFGRSVYAAYAEFLIPVISEDANIPLMQKLSFDVSGRYDKYSDFGDTENPRVAVDWDIVDGLKARGSYGTSFVAPALTSTGGIAGLTTESAVSYTTGTGGPTTIPVGYSNLGTGNSTQNGVLVGAGGTVGNATNMGVVVSGPGGPTVKPETSLSYSAGIDWNAGRMFAPLQGLTVSVTYWQAKYIGAITSPVMTLDTQIGALNKNLVINPTDAQIAAAYDGTRRVSSTPSGPITFLQYYVQQNAFNLWANGIDFNVNYAFSLFDWGDFDADVNGSQKLRFDQQGGGFGGTITNNLNKNANTTFSSVGFTGRAAVSWHLDPVKLNIAMNYTGSYYQLTAAPSLGAGFTASSRFVTLLNPTAAVYYIVPANVTTDVTLAYDLPAFNSWVSGTEVYLTAQNVFNESPPVYNAAVGYDTSDASPLGRLVMFGLRKKW